MTDEGSRYTSSINLYVDCAKQQRYIIDVQCEGRGAFQIDDRGIGIDWEQDGTAATHYFQTWALACWLELKGVLCLHANALAIPGSDSAIAIMAPSHTGKTTLSIALLAKGFELMTDDMVALYPSTSGKNSYDIYPGWPEFRMWPDSVEHSRALVENQLGAHLDDEPVHARFAKRKLRRAHATLLGKKRLKAIYVLERMDDPATGSSYAGSTSDVHAHERIRLRNITRPVALIQLLQNGILGSAFRALEIEQQRFAAMAELTNTIAVRQLCYQSGYEYLTEVAERLRQEVLST